MATTEHRRQETLSAIGVILLFIAPLLGAVILLLNKVDRFWFAVVCWLVVAGLILVAFGTRRKR